MQVLKIDHPADLKVEDCILVNNNNSLRIGKIEKFGQCCNRPSVDILFNAQTRDYLICYLSEMEHSEKYLLIDLAEKK